MIQGLVRHQTLQVRTGIIAADTIDYLTAAFTFLTPEWSGLDKWAHFSCGNKNYAIRLSGDRINESAHLNLSAGAWELYIHGDLVGDMGRVVQRVTTVTAKLVVLPSGIMDGEPFPGGSPSETEKLWATIGDLSELRTAAKADLVAAINEARLTGGGGGGGGGVTPGNALELTPDGVLNVVTAEDAEQNNTLPITSAAVYTKIGNIDALLSAI